MTVAVIALCGVVVTLVALDAVLTYKSLTMAAAQVVDAHQDADTRVAQVELERANAELKSQYEAARRHAAALKESLREALSKSDLGTGIAPDDVAARRMRLFERWEADADTTADDHGDADGAVPAGHEALAGGRPAAVAPVIDGGPAAGRSPAPRLPRRA